jgi:hypothetical protein
MPFFSTTGCRTRHTLPTMANTYTVEQRTDLRPRQPRRPTRPRATHLNVRTSRGQCYDLKNVFAQKMDEKLTVLTKNTAIYTEKKYIKIANFIADS